MLDRKFTTSEFLVMSTMGFRKLVFAGTCSTAGLGSSFCVCCARCCLWPHISPEMHLLGGSSVALTQRGRLSAVCYFLKWVLSLTLCLMACTSQLNRGPLWIDINYHFLFSPFILLSLWEGGGVGEGVAACIALVFLTRILLLNFSYNLSMSVRIDVDSMYTVQASAKNFSLVSKNIAHLKETSW